MTKLPEYHVGQVWKDRKRGAESMFVVTHVYVREYKNGERAQRVVGMQLDQESYSLNTCEVCAHGTTPNLTIPGDHLRDLDARSLHNMYPYQVWESYVCEPDPDDGK